MLILSPHLMRPLRLHSDVTIFVRYISLVVSMSIDPEKLQKWDTQKHDSKTMRDVFDKQFSMREKFDAMRSSNGAPMGINAHFDARQSLSCVAQMIDSGFSRALVQTSDNQQAIVIDTFSYQGSLIFERDDCPEFPLVLVRVAYHNMNLEDEFEGELLRMMCVQATANTMPSNGHVQSIKAGCPEEMRVLYKFFRKNSKLLSKEFVKKFEKGIPDKYLAIPSSFTTFISPLYTGSHDRICSVCGLLGKQNLCARCKLVFYCSRDCQSRDWKRHKVECLDISKLRLNTGSSYVEIDPAKSPEERSYACSISNKESWGMMKTDAKECAKHQRTVIQNLTVGEFHVMKVQVEMTAKVTDQSIICLYTKGKEFLLYADEKMFTDGVAGFRKLFQLVKDRGDHAGYQYGGVRLFVCGAATEDGKLQVMLDSVVAVQSW